jgi:hypothetical protein
MKLNTQRLPLLLVQWVAIGGALAIRALGTARQVFSCTARRGKLRQTTFTIERRHTLFRKNLLTFPMASWALRACMFPLPYIHMTPYVYGGRRCLFAQRSRRPRQQGRQRLSRWRAEISAGPGLPQGSFEAEDSPATERHAVVRELESVGRLCLSGVPAAQLRPGGELRRVGAASARPCIRGSSELPQPRAGAPVRQRLLRRNP